MDEKVTWNNKSVITTIAELNACYCCEGGALNEAVEAARSHAVIVSQATNCNTGSACKVSYVPHRYNKQTMNRFDHVFCPGEQFTLHCLAIVCTL